MPELEPITREEKFLNGEVGMTPITREEKILAGEDVETITRREYFLKKYRGGGGGDVTVEEITITENGTTTAPSGKAYSPIHTNVPQPTLSTLEVSENGDYDAPSGTAYNRVEVALPLDDKTITQNGTYLASDDNLEGYDEVIVDVPLPENAYLNKALTGLPADIATFNDGADAPMKSLKVSIEPQQSGSGDPSPTNIRPISGWSEVKVSVINDSTKAPFFRGLLNGTYNFNDLGSLTWFKSGNDTFYTRLPDHKVVAGNSSINAISSNGMEFLQMPGSGNGEYIIITDSDYASYTAVKFREAMNGVYLIYELATPTTPTITPQQFNTLLEAFNINGQTYTIDLDGTRYGGELDVVNGSGTNDRGYIVFDGSSDENWVVQGTAGFFIDVSDKKAGMGNYIANNYKATNSSGWESLTPVDNFSGHPTLSRLYFRYPYEGFSADLTAWRAWLASNNVQVVYELATPTTYETQPTSIKSLRGVNNLFADCGQVQELSYFSKEV